MTNQERNIISELIYQFSRLNLDEVFSWLGSEFPDEVVFSSSFSEEDQIITYKIVEKNLPIKIFTLDTGRLFSETYSVWSRTVEKYDIKIEAYYPQPEPLQKFITDKGPNAFYSSVENRKTCCYIRKVEPLQRALAGNKIWVTGLRAAHSQAREKLESIEWDEINQIIKFHPLLHWSNEEVNHTIQQYNIPYNSLHDKGFVSIGCAPCTRAIKTGEDFRAGRWWWEDASKKECGLHVSHTIIK